MWESQVENQKLTFHLAGINNQNFIMRDDETGSWWQQVSGEAIQGPLKGRKLNPVFMDEISFAIWKKEFPKGRVLKPDDRVSKNYEAADWEEQYAKFPVVTQADAKDKIRPRELMIGLVINGQAKAYPLTDLQKQNLILDELGGKPIFLILGEDKKSVRAFERIIDGKKLEFFAKPETTTLQIVDAETGSMWDFSGKAIQGAMTGKQLTKIPVLKDYWFDWKIYHPTTFVYTLGGR